MTNLHLIYGFAGAGKTTFARKLETEISAIRFTHDESMVKLYGNNPDEEKFPDYYERISDLIWNLTMQLLRLDRDVILDFGFWSRKSRDEARCKAKIANAQVKLYFVTCSEVVMRKRVAIRNNNLPSDSLWIDENAFELFKQSYEALGDDENYIIIETDV
ncbi:AAA family ATPase [Calothrix sp. CCY 0018]|uniref:AAA family ATPase n=1 Tax=Calothrix sp. CCY 0018 TaxID=3103864 RepID=UPI0039C61301